MKKLSILCVLVSILISPSVFSSSSKTIPQSIEIHEWVIPGSGNISPGEAYGSPYVLKNVTNNNRTLVSEKRSGINLGWEASLGIQGGNIGFERRVSGSAPIMPRESIAISVTYRFPKTKRSDSQPAVRREETVMLTKVGYAGCDDELTEGYLYYITRDYGINLCFSAVPKYEWEIRSYEDPSEPDDWKPVQLGTRMSIFNQKEKDYLVYCPRDRGINLRWAKDCQKYHDFKQTVP